MKNGLQRTDRIRSEISTCYKSAKSTLSPFSGVGLSFFTGVCEAFTYFFIILSQLEGIGEFKILVAAFFLKLVFSSVLLLINRTPVFSYELKDIIILSCIAVLRFGAFLSVGFALKFTPFGNVSTVQLASQMIITAILSSLLLKEKLVWIDAIIFLLEVAGIILVSQPRFMFHHYLDSIGDSGITPIIYPNPTPGYILALVAALCQSMIFVLSRKLAGKIESYTVVFYIGLLGLPTSMVLAYAIETPAWPIHSLKYAAGVAIFGLLTAYSLNESLKREVAKTVAFLTNIEIVMSFILQKYILRVPSNKLTIVGIIAVILGSTLSCGYVWWQKRLQAKQVQNDSDEEINQETELEEMKSDFDTYSNYLSTE